MFYRRFLFGQDSGNADVTGVRAGDLYCPDKGYGFVTEKNRREQEPLKISELNAAFDTMYWYRDEDLSHIEEDCTGCFLESKRKIACLEDAAGEKFSGEHRRIPLSFKIDVPKQGNYKVTVAIYTMEPMEDVLIFTGRRRLGFRGEIKESSQFDRAKATVGNGMAKDRDREEFKGIVFRHTMTVNVCDIVPRGHTNRFEDKSLDITILADRPKISEMIVEEISCPTLYIAGDSTVTDQSADYPYAPGTSYSGWGQMISAYLKGELAVSNHAHSGLTTASFREEGHYEILCDFAAKGDCCFFQFGHNDQKLDELKAWGGYRENLLRYLKECRERGIFPLIVTPIARNTWKGNDGSYNDLLEEYAQVCLEVGEQENVPVVDLHRRSMEFVVKNGLEASKAYFFPGDYTHSNDYGAYYMAGIVADEVVRVCGGRKEPAYHFLAECVTEGFGAWEPKEDIVPPVKPAIYENVANPEEGALLLEDVDRLSEPADRASALDMIIKTVRFFPTNVYNDMFTDVVGHEWYAGCVECAYQNGMIDKGLVEEHKFFPLQSVTLEEFLIFAVNGYKSRRTIPQEVWEMPCVYDERCREFAKPYIRAACHIGLIQDDGGAALDRVLTRGEAVAICRSMNV